VKVLEKKDEQTQEGIWIPGVANANLLEGLVKMIDPAFKEIIPEGNIVIFPMGCGVGQFIGTAPYLWLSLSDIWATFSMDKE